MSGRGAGDGGEGNDESEGGGRPGEREAAKLGEGESLQVGDTSDAASASGPTRPEIQVDSVGASETARERAGGMWAGDGNSARVVVEGCAFAVGSSALWSGGDPAAEVLCDAATKFQVALPVAAAARLTWR